MTTNGATRAYGAVAGQPSLRDVVCREREGRRHERADEVGDENNGHGDERSARGAADREEYRKNHEGEGNAEEEPEREIAAHERPRHRPDEAVLEGSAPEDAQVPDALGAGETGEHDQRRQGDDGPGGADYVRQVGGSGEGHGEERQFGSCAPGREAGCQVIGEGRFPARHAVESLSWLDIALSVSVY
ncbi:MAG: hypothetical protein E6G57_05425 [Actinobacteria bacterium]|nr:MAG: hypothetical protein E6G57_05425 [Actinomycetota bacterium]